MEGAVVGGDPGEEDEEGHDVDVPEALQAQEHGTVVRWKSLFEEQLSLRE